MVLVLCMETKNLCIDMEVGLFLLLGGIVIDCRMVLVSCLWHIMWSKLGGYCRRWTRVVPGWFLVENGRVPKLPRHPLACRFVESMP